MSLRMGIGGAGRRRIRRATVLAALLLPTGMLPVFTLSASAAATIEVTTTVDELKIDGDCSLREAVRAANLDDPIDECTEGDGTDTIKVPAGTYVLSKSDPAPEDLAMNGDLDITSSVKIRGRGVDRTIIDGNATDRVFEVTSGGNATVGGFTIRDGDTIGQQNGGGLLVRNGGAAILKNLTIKNNKAGANGGGVGVETAGDLSAKDVTITNNEAMDFSGGGVFNNNPDIDLDSVTIRGNRANLDGGGLLSYGGFLLNSTVSGNRADLSGGGIYVDSGFLSIMSSTITRNVADEDANGTGNGGGITREDPDPPLGHTIVANNTDRGGEVPDCDGEVNSLGYNLIEDTTGCTILGDPTGNVIGQDPNLGPLAANGGPTPTHALGPDSPAINAGNTIGTGDDQCRSTDQRGAPRKRCDLGAYERVVCRKILVNRVGTNARDTLTGTTGRDGIIGLGGRDKLIGRGGSDALCGQAGDDRLLGKAGGDRLDGGPGSDTGNGGPGDDTCVGVETKIGPCPRP